MPTPSAEIIQVISVFAVAFSAPTFAKVLTLLPGVILSPGRRTVTAALRMVGLADDKNSSNYHRILNRDHWSPMVLSKLLLGLIMRVFPRDGWTLVLLVDDTLERRDGRKIRYKSRFYDAVLSTANKVVTSMGLRWICMSVLVCVPWSKRQWALPFMVILTLAPRTSEKLHKPHRTLVDWACFMIERVRRWQPENEIFLVGDGSYAAIVLIQRCQRLKKPVHLISRLRLDAVLHDPPPPQPKGKRGPRPKKGERQMSLAQRLVDPATVWEEAILPWYGGFLKKIRFASGIALWYSRGNDPVPVRWVLVRATDNSFKPAAFFCSDQSIAPLLILNWFVSRWNIEVTFEELRAHLGFETQRQWSDRAIERTTPCLFGIFSLIVIFAKTLYPQSLPIRQAEWYKKDEATFSDILAVVRRSFWDNPNIRASSKRNEMLLIPRTTLSSLLEVACYST
jgi:hypothetical protein